MRGRGMDSYGSGQGKMADLCEHGKNLSICIKYEKYFEKFKNYERLKMVSAQ